MIGGRPNNKKYQEAKKALRDKYRFGSWKIGQFDFAGARLTHLRGKSIESDMQANTDQYIEELRIPTDRAQQTRPEYPLRDLAFAGAKTGLVPGRILPAP